MYLNLQASLYKFASKLSVNKLQCRTNLCTHSGDGGLVV